MKFEGLPALPEKEVAEGKESLELSPELENQEKPKPSEVFTERGSVYRYLPDGRTQRFQTATGKLHEAQDTLTFIPPYDSIKEQALRLYPSVFRGVESTAQYEQLLLEYAQLENRTIRVMDQGSIELATNAEIEAAERAFLAFIDRDNSGNGFTLPVSKEPKLGYLTFDTKKYKGEDGKTYRERHIGNRVIDIKYSQE